MLALDRDALICDMAQTYGVYDLGTLPVSTVATLAVGLREDSRIMMRLADARISRTDMLLAGVVDRLSLLLWSQTENGRKGTDRPRSVLDILIGGGKRSGDVEAFETAEEFRKAWEEITGVSYG